MLKKNSIEIGDLVRLSYYGRKLKTNPAFMWGKKGKRLLGIIKYLSDKGHYPVTVAWFGEHTGAVTCHGYKELKIARR